MIRLLLPLLLITSLGLASLPASPALALDLDEIQEELSTNLDRLDKMRGKVSTEEEIEIGGNLISGLLGASPLVDDRRLQRYVNDVGFWVAAQSARSKLPWRFGVIKSKGINAFAAPGGYIVITLGLYQLLENEAQLAGVLAHEIAHVVRKHHLKVLQKTMKREFWTDLTVEAAGDMKHRKTMQKLINSGVQLYATGLDRKYEFEADLRGVVLVARAGYDPFAFLDVLTTIDSINPQSEALTVLMNTHPPTDDRLDALARKMDGRLDSYASGVDNADRFRKVMAAP
ncbi:MAG: M48 family metalloprotease [Gammaproteobacteria bacterium]|nr:M48 family metalloprotease [Gammaproteobacteria bacterium]